MNQVKAFNELEKKMLDRASELYIDTLDKKYNELGVLMNELYNILEIGVVYIDKSPIEELERCNADALKYVETTILDFIVESSKESLNIDNKVINEFREDILLAIGYSTNRKMASKRMCIMYSRLSSIIQSLRDGLNEQLLEALDYLRMVRNDKIREVYTSTGCKLGEDIFIVSEIDGKKYLIADVEDYIDIYDNLDDENEVGEERVFYRDAWLEKDKTGIVTEKRESVNKIFDYKEMERLAIKNGYKYSRSSGDHNIYTHEISRKSIVIPAHELGKGLMLNIQKQIFDNKNI